MNDLGPGVMGFHKDFWDIHQLTFWCKKTNKHVFVFSKSVYVLNPWYRIFWFKDGAHFSKLMLCTYLST